MTKEITVFNFRDNTIRTDTTDGSAWFCLADVCEALNLRRGYRSAARLNEKGVRKTYIPTNGGKQEVTYINEPNLYRLIFRSNKPQAQAFADWVYEEVLPSIRKTGCYNSAPALDAKAIGGIVKKCAAKAVKDEIANVRPAPFQVATAYEQYAFEDTVKRLVRETLVDFFASKDNFPHPSGMAIDGIVKKCASGDLLKTLNLLSERIDNMGRNMTRGFPSAWERSVVRYATDAAQAVGAPAYVQTYVTKAEYVLLCSVRGVDIPLMTA